MRVSIFTGKKCQIRSDRKQSLIEACKIARNEKSDLLLLPGWSITGEDAALSELAEISNQYNLNILGEVSSEQNKSSIVFYLFKPNKKPKGPFHQFFSTSHEAEKDISIVVSLNSVLSSGKRDFTIKGKKLRLVICGEQNIIKNIQSENNRPTIRHNLDFSMNYDVILNPSHDTMGNWGKIHKRFCYLSRDGRYVLYTTNNKKNSWISAISVYHDGEKILSGDRAVNKASSAKYYKEKDWRLVTLSLKCG